MSRFMPSLASSRIVTAPTLALCPSHDRWFASWRVRTGTGPGGRSVLRPPERCASGHLGLVQVRQGQLELAEVQDLGTHLLDGARSDVRRLLATPFERLPAVERDRAGGTTRGTVDHHAGAA